MKTRISECKLKRVTFNVKDDSYHDITEKQASILGNVGGINGINTNMYYTQTLMLSVTDLCERYTD